MATGGGHAPKSSRPANGVVGGDGDFRTCLMCQICLDDSRDPRMLPCFHTFCLQCITSYAKKKGNEKSFTCPVCHVKVRVPRGGVRKLCKNFLLTSVRNIVPGEEEEEERENEKPKLKAKDCNLCIHHRCHKCHKVMTPKDIAAAASLSDNRASRVSSCPSKIVSRPSGRPTIKCTTHPAEDLRFYCKDDGDVLCMKCIFEVEHSKHEFVHIDDVIDDQRGEIKNAVDEARGNLPLLGAHQDCVDGTLIKSLVKHQELTKSIKSQADKVHSQIDLHHADLITRVNTLYEAEAELLNKMKAKLDTHKVSLDRVLEFTDLLTTSGTDAEIMQHGKRLSAKLKEHAEDEMPKPEFWVNCTYERPNVPDEIMSKLMGDINVQLDPVNISLPGDKKQVELVGQDDPSIQQKIRTISILPFRVASVQTIVTKQQNCTPISTELYGDQSKPELGDIAVDPESDEIYVVDRANRCVKQFSPCGEFKMLLNLSKVIVYPNGLAVLEGGNIAIGSSNTIIDTPNEIKVISMPDAVAQLSIKMNDIRAFCQGKRGLFLVLKVSPDNRKIFVFRKNEIRRSMDVVPQVKNPWHMVVNTRTGNIVLSDWENCIWILNYEGEILSRYGVVGTQGSAEGMLACPSGVCIDRRGYILVADWKNARVVMLTPQGELVCYVASVGQLAAPLEVAVNKWGQLLVTDSDDKGQIKVFRYIM